MSALGGVGEGCWMEGRALGGVLLERKRREENEKENIEKGSLFME